MLWLGLVLPIIGGTVDTTDPAVVDVTIAGGQCSGVLVAPRVVITAAHCARPGLDAQTGTVDLGGTTATITAIWIDRYDDGSVAHDLAAVRLDRDAAIAPLEIAAPVAGAVVRLVGFGLDGAGVRGVRRSVDATVGALTARTFTAGTTGATTCTGDSGGAAIDALGRLVGIVSAGDATCTGAAQLVQPLSELQLVEVIDAWTHGATDPCGFDGTCAVDCAAVDLDCPLGGAAGDSCAASPACESRTCVAAPEGGGAFCSASCATDGDCPAPLGTCADQRCVYTGRTPGIAGETCAADADCRSGLCDADAAICTSPCAGGCPADLACEPIRDTHACTRPAGCTASRDPALGAAILLALRRRRRPLQSSRGS